MQLRKENYLELQHLNNLDNHLHHFGSLGAGLERFGTVESQQ
jgi:hypothetical protein